MFSSIRRLWRNIRLFLSYGKRAAWLEKVMEEVWRIGNHPGVRQSLPEAAKRLEYLEKRSSTWVPTIGASNQWTWFDLTDPKEGDLPSLAIMLMMATDRAIDKVAAYAYDRGFASYNASWHMITLKVDRIETPRFWAYGLIHEVGHSIAAEEEGRILEKAKSRGNTRERLEEELRMWRFDYELALILGGLEFQGHMEASIAKACTRLQQGIFNFGAEGWEMGSLLDLVYGPAPNEEAVARRAFLCAIYCELIALDRLFPQPLSYDYQLACMKSFCEQGYIEEGVFVAQYGENNG